MVAAEYVKTSLSFADIDRLKRQALHEAPYSARVSIALVCRLIRLRGVISDYDIIDEINALEGVGRPTNTKKDEGFKSKQLGRFRHKHFSSPRHTWHNIGDAWGFNIPEDTRETAKRFQAFGALVEECWTKHQGDPHKTSLEALHRFAIEGLTKRSAAKEMTGDWIVFARYQGLNYYLDLAKHDEGHMPDKLLKKLRDGSEAEFPFLFS